MKFTQILILFAILGCVAVALSMLFPGVFIWACAIAFIVFMLGVALSFEIFFKERKERAKIMKEGDELEAKYAQVGEGPYTTPKIDGEDYRVELRNIRVNSYVKYFNIDARRAAVLYDNGFDNLSKISKAEAADLAKLDGINPTMAKKIIEQVRD